MNEDSLVKRRKESAEGARISEFLNDDIVKRVLQRLADQYRDAVMTDLDSIAWHKHKALADILTELVTIVQTGRLAEEQLARFRNGT